MQLMKRNINDYEEQMLKIFGSKQNMKDIRWTQLTAATAATDISPRCINLIYYMSSSNICFASMRVVVG